jgi:hypothetical protein
MVFSVRVKHFVST